MTGASATSDPPPRHHESYLVRSYETDPYGRASVRTLLLLLQESATGHSIALDVAVRFLIENRLAWVLTRLHLETERWPRGGDTITVETWPHAASRLMVERRFRVHDADGETLGSATTMWVVLDLERRRPIRLPPFIVDALAPVVGDRLPATLDKIPELDTAENRRMFEVRYADLDMVHHVNNAAYVQWATETTPEELWQSHLPAVLDVHYLAECRLGDTVESASRRLPEPGDPAFLHVLRRQSDGAEVLRARTLWRRFAADG
jgi:medium-chain acyl-[acyl-carrier-protein] hydrolase